MLLPPLAYSAYVFTRAAHASSEGKPEISVLLVQPNVDPWEKMEQEERANTLGKTMALTDLALSGIKPDLLIWPETAVPYALLQDEAVRDFVSQAVARWDAPLLSGTFDLRADQVAQANSALAKNQPEAVQLFNAALLLAPGQKQPDAKYGVSSSAVYHKQVLMPFAERVPFADRFPALERLAFDFNVGGNFLPGREATVLSFRDRQGCEHTLAAPICYEQIYPAKVAELVRNGAQMLAVLTNEGWFAKTHGAYQIAAFSRLRAIETRRAVARTANTGLTCLIDEFGRTVEQAPWWTEQTLFGRVQLSDEQSFYVRYTDYFPRACLALALALGAAALFARVWQWLRRRMPLPGEARPAAAAN
jgi:apolipoprotein N-acyltransferase